MSLSPGHTGERMQITAESMEIRTALRVWHRQNDEPHARAMTNVEHSSIVQLCGLKRVFSSVGVCMYVCSMYDYHLVGFPRRGRRSDGRSPVATRAPRLPPRPPRPPRAASRTARGTLGRHWDGWGRSPALAGRRRGPGRHGWRRTRIRHARMALATAHARRDAVAGKLPHTHTHDTPMSCFTVVTWRGAT